MDALFVVAAILFSLIMLVALLYSIFRNCEHSWKIISNKNYYNVPWRRYEQITVVQCEKCSKVKHIRSE